MISPSLEGLVADPRYEQELKATTDLFARTHGRWRVLYHNDGDGIASASVAAHLLSRLGRPWQLTPLLGVERAGVERVLRATRGPLLVVDTGSSFLDLFALHPHPVVVLDHHAPPAQLPVGERLAFANPHDWGVDGMTELSASMLTYVFARRLLPTATDLLAFGLSGAIADRMHVGGFRGPNRTLVEEGERAGFLRIRRAVNLTGPTLEAALAQSVDPYFVGLSGRLGACRTLLSSLGLPPEAPPTSLSQDEARRLTSALLLRLLAQGTRPEFCERVQEEFLVLPESTWEAHELSRWQNAAGREGEPSQGIALALGDAHARARVSQLEAQWREGVLEGLKAIESAGLRPEAAVQWFETPKANLAGTIAGLALTYFADPTRPLLSFSDHGSNVKVSSRGTLWLTEHGLDLDRACREAAQKVGGEGGGHRVASGATIPKGREPDFRREVDRIVGGQLAALRGSAAGPVGALNPAGP
jgi:single-stranded-DNA-specific exonuclease